MKITFQVGNIQFVRDDEFRPYFRSLEDFSHWESTVLTSAPIEGSFTRTSFLRANVNFKINNQDLDPQTLVNYCVTTHTSKKWFWFIEGYTLSGSALKYHLYLDCWTTYVSQNLGQTFFNETTKRVHVIRRHDFAFVWNAENNFPIKFNLNYPSQQDDRPTLLFNQDDIPLKDFFTTDTAPIYIYGSDSDDATERQVQLHFSWYTYAWYFVASREGPDTGLTPYERGEVLAFPSLTHQHKISYFTGLLCAPVYYRYVNPPPSHFTPGWDPEGYYYGWIANNSKFTNHAENLLFNDNGTLKTTIHAPFCLPVLNNSFDEYTRDPDDLTGLPSGTKDTPKPSFYINNQLDSGTERCIVTFSDGFYETNSPPLFFTRRDFTNQDKSVVDFNTNNPLFNFIYLLNSYTPTALSTADFSYLFEPKILTSQFLKFSIRSLKGSEYVINNERNFWDRTFTDLTLNKLAIYRTGVVSPMDAYIYFSFNTPGYKLLGTDLNQIVFEVGFVGESETSYTEKFLLEHMSQYNASVAQSKIGIGLASAKFAAGVALGVAAPMALGVENAITKSALAGGGAGLIGVGGLINSTFSLWNLHAKMHDIERQPSQLHLPRGDEISPSVLRTQKEGHEFSGFGSSGCALVTRQLPINQQKSLANHYNKYGYLANNHESLSYGTLGFYKRDFNYWEISKISNAFDRTTQINLQVINEIDNLFAKGVRLWTYHQVDFIMENYERLNIDNPINRPHLSDKLTPSKKRK